MGGSTLPLSAALTLSDTPQCTSTPFFFRLPLSVSDRITGGITPFVFPHRTCGSVSMRPAGRTRKRGRVRTGAASLRMR